ncbi:hypothetical protein ACU686_10860 [Yinghuangia aomiensis]
MCSTFKTLAVGAVLRDLDQDGEFLDTRLHYTEQDTTAAGYARSPDKPTTSRTA